MPVASAFCFNSFWQLPVKQFLSIPIFINSHLHQFPLIPGHRLAGASSVVNSQQTPVVRQHLTELIPFGHNISCVSHQQINPARCQWLTMIVASCFHICSFPSFAIVRGQRGGRRTSAVVHQPAAQHNTAALLIPSRPMTVVAAYPSCHLSIP